MRIYRDIENGDLLAMNMDETVLRVSMRTCSYDADPGFQTSWSALIHFDSRPEFRPVPVNVIRTTLDEMGM